MVARMARLPTSPPEPALKALLDEVIVPILVARFLREHAAADPERERPGDVVSRSRDFETVRVGSSPG